MAHALQKFSKIILLLLAVYLAIQYLLPLILPFLLGAGLAFGAEPLVAFGCQRLRLPRSLSAGLGVSIAFSFLALVVMVLCALTVRELSTLARILPDLETAVLSGMDSLSRWMLGIAQNAPGSIRTVLSRFVTELFSGGAALVDRIISASLDLATGLLSRVPGSALLLGTAIISSFMISAKLPRLKVWFSDRFPKENFRSALDSLTRLKSAVGGWLLAQLKLCGITCVLCAAGLLILRVRHAPLWAVLIALVDAFPILGVGAALVPWSLVAFLQGDRFLAFGLLILYALIAVTRSILEPRLIGRQLGLDPLVTLMALYAGFHIWGFAGMILAPLLAVTVTQLLPQNPEP